MWFFLYTVALFSFTTSSQLQWSQKEFLSHVTEHCEAATTIKETQQQWYWQKRLKSQKCFCSLDPSLPPEVAGVELHSYFPVSLQVKPVDGVSKATGLSLNPYKWINQVLYSLKYVWKSYPRSCETKYWHKTAAVL